MIGLSAAQKVELQIQAQVRCAQRFLYKQKSNSPLGHVLYLAISAIDFFRIRPPRPISTSHIPYPKHRRRQRTLSPT